LILAALKDVENKRKRDKQINQDKKEIEQIFLIKKRIDSHKRRQKNPTQR
jgi:hypothetical protein